MKKLALILVICISMLSAVAYVSADVAQKPEKGIIVGTAIEISTYAMKGIDEGSTEAMRNRCELGFPVGILDDETGQVYVCVYRNSAPASGLELANDVMVELMGMKVAAQGLKYRAKGAYVLRLSVISEY